MRLALALLLALLAASGAAADHVYSHRYVLEGRLVGSDGLPIANRTVEFFAEGDTFDEACLDGHRPVTDENGDFRFCFHKHDLNVSGQVGARAGNASEIRPMDTAFRRSVLILHEPNETGVDPGGWEREHLVAGRVWRTGPTELEGVRVYGEAVPDVQVNVTLRGPDGTGSIFDAVTDAYGDFRVPLRLQEGVNATNVTVEVEVLGMTQTRLLEPDSHRLTVGVILPSEFQASFPDTPFDFSSRPTYPGTQSPRVSPVLFVVGALALAAALALGRKKD